MERLFRKVNGKVTPDVSPLVSWPSLEWKATELVDGAKVRVTTRSYIPVRLEVECKPTREQRVGGIEDSWYRDASVSDMHPDFWLREAVSETSFTVPDGEWVGVAIGPKIKKNYYGLSRPSVMLSDLLGVGDESHYPVPPVLKSCPIEFNQLSDWFQFKKSELNSDVPIFGVVWWYLDTPVAFQLRSDFCGEES